MRNGTVGESAFRFYSIRHARKARCLLLPLDAHSERVAVYLAARSEGHALMRTKNAWVASLKGVWD
jgi:hypothetical protein